MRVRSILIVAVLVALAFGVGRLSAAVGTLDSPDVPANTQSFTLEDIYNRLDTGAEDGPSAFTEPAAGPGTGTMYDLNDIMVKAPAIDNTNGATETNVLDGKTFWGLTAGQWGPQAGTMPDREGDNASTAQAQSGGVNYFTAPDGYYDGDDRVTATDAEVRALDTDIVSGNVRSGVNIFGVAGDPMVVNTSSGDAAAGDVKDGKKAWVDGGEVTGNIPTQTVSNTTVSQLAGYYDAFDLAVVDTDLVSGNIRSTVSIYGVDGDPMVVNTSSGDAVTADIKDGKKAWVDGAEVTGNIPTQTVDNTTVSQLAGYYDAFDLAVVDTDLVSGNIRSTVSIYGVDGDPMVVNTGSGDAAVADIKDGKKAWVDGSEVTGNVAAGSNVNGPDGFKEFNIPDGLYSGSKTCTANDTQLVAGNIKSGVDIFGVTGSYAGTICTGDATTADVLYPKTFSNSGSTGLTGKLHGGCTCCITCTLHASRWCDNGDGTVTDLTTCLVWLKDADWGDNGDWPGAHTRAGKLNAGTSGAGLSDGSVLGDWRLPTRNEFDHLLNGSPNIRCTAVNSKCSVYGFTGIAGKWATAGGAEGNYGYWTSTTMAGNDSRAYYIEPATGAVPNEAKSDGYGLVWPVRGGQ